MASVSKSNSERSNLQRGKGRSSRNTILLAAAKLATTEGLTGLSLGTLASELGMSKSGLYAHFKSKQELELATIETAAEIFDSEVLQPALMAPPGIERIRALVNSFLSHIERGVFPGGCFFAAAAAELDTRPGLTRDRVVEVLNKWFSLLKQCIGDAKDLREISPDTEVPQVVFEIEAMLLAGNFLFIMMNDSIHLIQARDGVENVLKRLAVNANSQGR
ncbi:MAG: hypothetical protein N5P05_003820 [Chroococcopsis gigantea SAG 12.99]|jgi:AcrR family transcriptional regulator|nr:TetR/AcrR family transcriptional regulator [Chlorogloea purpurea SAG 13.99]MDV3002214.1 hypothetical protein [Chroococcopsis gigantea SAG 12.99]